VAAFRGHGAAHRVADTAVRIAGDAVGCHRGWKEVREALRCLKKSAPQGGFPAPRGAGRWQRYSIRGMGEPAMANELSGA